MKLSKTRLKKRSKNWMPLILTVATICPISNPEAAVEAKPYAISRGDTLSQIAERIYGNWAKFKELWEINKDRITNPNLIFPGQRLRLIDGEEIDLVAQSNVRGSGTSDDPFESGPDVAVGDLVASNAGSGGNSSSRKSGRQGRRTRSNEWQLLPQQSWEKFNFKLPTSVGMDGFDNRSRVGIRYKDTINMPAEITTDRMAVLGEITGGRSEYSSFAIGEQVLIRAEEELQVGKTYSLTNEPVKIQSHRDSRVGFMYRLTGKIRIVGVRDQLFVGTIVQAYMPVMREQILVGEVAQARLIEAIAAPSPLVASIVEDESEYSYNLSAHRIIYLDVGTEDGVKPGMIFRRYQHVDPMTGKTLSTQDFLVEAEVKILSAHERFSIAVVLNGRSPMNRHDELVALMDVSDLGKHLGLQGAIQERGEDNLDDLDQMDPTQGLGEQEDRELRQLENTDPESGETNSESSNDIQKVEVNSTSRQAVEIGRERGPNDRSGPSEKTQAAPPSDVPSDAPVGDAPLTAPAPSDEALDAPAPAPDAPADEAPPAETPVSAPDTTPANDALDAPAAAATPSDPFATDSFKTNEVEPAPVTESNPNPPGDPLLDAIPESTPAP